MVARDEKTPKSQISIQHHPTDEISEQRERETDKQLDEQKNFGECFGLAVCFILFYFFFLLKQFL